MLGHDDKLLNWVLGAMGALLKARGILFAPIANIELASEDPWRLDGTFLADSEGLFELALDSARSTAADAWLAEVGAAIPSPDNPAATDPRSAAAAGDEGRQQCASDRNVKHPVQETSD
jgi:hypothetical protein